MPPVYSSDEEDIYEVFPGSWREPSLSQSIPSSDSSLRISTI
jgi:hypothetical protein